MIKYRYTVLRGHASQKGEKMDIREQITGGKASIGIEFGSTRIKAILVGDKTEPVASGAHDWQNSLENGVWTYSEEDIIKGLQSCFASLMADVKEKYGVQLTTAASIGISAMMHGYLAFDENDRLLVPFRTWRNTMTGEAADILSESFAFNIPQRWSIAHLYQAIQKKEEHIPQVRFITTLAGYVHFLLTGEKNIGIGDASGMFPIDPETGSYNKNMLAKFAQLTENTAFSQQLIDILPAIVPVGECAGRLTENGAKLLDPTGVFGAGVPFCPAEGDAQTGMVATNSIAPRTGNVSAGTSIFAMVVLERELSRLHRQIDIVTTPCGDPVAMVHCNNCTTELNGWVELFDELLRSCGCEMTKTELYNKLFAAALEGDSDCSGIINYNYHSGEHVTGFTEGRPMLMRSPESKFNIPNVMRSLIYSCMSTLKIGMDILFDEEKVTLDNIYAHGGLFKSPVTGQRFLASALGVPVTLMTSAGEGGAWGIALLAAYQARENREEKLADYLSKRVFAGAAGNTMAPHAEDAAGFAEYMKLYRAGLAAEQAAVEAQ